MLNIDTRNKPGITPSSQTLRALRRENTAPAESVKDNTRISDRRRNPERRRQARPEYKGKERRRLPDRRSPQLLGARDGKPESIDNKKGGIINTEI